MIKGKQYLHYPSRSIVVNAKTIDQTFKMRENLSISPASFFGKPSIIMNSQVLINVFHLKILIGADALSVGVLFHLVY